MKIAIIALGNAGTNSNLFNELGDHLSARHDVTQIKIDLLKGSSIKRALRIIKSNLRHIRAIAKCDTAIFHVTVLHTAPLFVISLLFGLRTIVFQWDIYPTTLAGKIYKDSLFRRMMFFIEHMLLRFASVIVIPSEDFRPFVTAKNVTVMPLWPQGALELRPVAQNSPDDDKIHIAFAGQINILRGLNEFVQHISAISSERIVLHLFSADTFHPASQLTDRMEIIHHGVLPRRELQDKLSLMHFGLISLNPQLDQPGFPSKTFDYLAAGIPILYFGRPLPSYVGLLEECGVGQDISNLSSLKIWHLHSKLAPLLEDGRQSLFHRTTLDTDRSTLIFAPHRVKRSG